MNHLLRFRIACFCAVLIFYLPAPAQAAEKARLEKQNLIIDRIHLKTLVEKLEMGQWLKRENERLLKKIQLTQELTDSLQLEIIHQKKAIAKLKESLFIAKKKMENAEQKIVVMEEDAGDYREIRETSLEMNEAQEKQKKTLRRRLAGQIYVLWTVSAVGGALIILLLL